MAMTSELCTAREFWIVVWGDDSFRCRFRFSAFGEIFEPAYSGGPVLVGSAHLLRLLQHGLEDSNLLIP